MNTPDNFSVWDEDTAEFTHEQLGIPKEIKVVAPNIPDIKIVHDLPSEIKLSTPDGKPITITCSVDFIDPCETNQVRKAIMDALMQLPEHKTDLDIPKWIGSPPMSEVIKVKGDILRTMAYYEWEKAGKPEGKQDDFWFVVEKRFDDALFCWF